ncbi:hypothetical protein AYK25_02705 [Thermoplasmatales archaeon SM1-50]|nr:MAG: hypothetical protein AYK25_02705 [Thermoplasmatales archaeon SM1-50]
MVPICIPVVNSTYSPKENITNQTSLFFNASLSEIYGQDVIYYWDFGNGIKVNETNAITTHIYAIAGVYTISLTISIKNGLLDYITKDIIIS